MSMARRIVRIITGILIVAGAIIMMLLPDIGYLVIALILGISLLVAGIGSLIYFFTMARHMVGGRDTLYKGLILTDLAFFTLSVSDVPKIFIMLYLVAIFGVTGLLQVLRGLEAKKKHAPSWYWSFVNGLVNLFIALLCMVFMKNDVVMVVIYSIGLVVAGIGRIISAFHKSAVVYIQ